MGTVNVASDRRSEMIVRVSAGCELLLMALTWKLWFCGSSFPRIPMLSPLGALPDPAVVTLSALFALLTLSCAIRPPNAVDWAPRVAGFGTLALGAAAVCCNQHCLQPWHWMFLLMLLFRIMTPEAHVMNVWRVLAATIYLFAALSRVGPKIDEGMSRQIAITLLGLGGSAAPAVNSSFTSWLCIAFTLGEFLTGAALLRARTSRSGMFAGITMHAVLLLAMGPFGLRQHAPVVVWNLYLIVWLWLLFHRRPDDAGAPWRESRTALLAAAFCFVWPTLSLIGITDAWTGWQVYSPRPAVVSLQIHRQSRNLIPLADAFINEPRLLDEWQTVRMDRWSLDEAGVPIYPSGRFQLAIAAWLTHDIQPGSEPVVRASMDSPASPFWWRRSMRDLPDVSAIRNAAGR